jgi:hypothetical protein
LGVAHSCANAACLMRTSGGLNDCMTSAQSFRMHMKTTS